MTSSAPEHPPETVTHQPPEASAVPQAAAEATLAAASVADAAPPAATAAPSAAPSAATLTVDSPAALTGSSARSPSAGGGAESQDGLLAAQAPWMRWVPVAAVVVAGVGLTLAWSAQQRMQMLEQELVRRQESSQTQTTEARLLAQQARDSSSEMAAKLALLEARVAESAMQRSQVEELIQSMSRSRDENVLADVESALRVAQQQVGITGSPEPLVAALKTAEERLSRYNQPRLERVRRAIARDLDKARAVNVVDVPTLSIRLDEAVRLMDELPLVNQPEGRNGRSLVQKAMAADAEVSTSTSATAAPVSATASATSPTSASATRSQANRQAGNVKAGPAEPGWQEWLSTWGKRAWDEIRGLVRVTRIDYPEAALAAPDQAYFLRENLKLRLLNARLALMTRQFDQARTDLELAESALSRYFDPQSRRVTVALELVRQVAAQSRQVVLPRPDDTLAALATASAGR